jgi:glyoxylase I family protein
MAAMKTGKLHHVTVMSTDLDRSVEFYTRALGMTRAERPPFPNVGAWLAAPGFMVHVNLNPKGTFRARKVIDGDDIHFAVRVDDFEAAVIHLTDAGFRETDDEHDPLRMIVKRMGAAGFPQVYVMDPDGHVIEINAAQ